MWWVCGFRTFLQIAIPLWLSGLNHFIPVSSQEKGFPQCLDLGPFLAMQRKGSNKETTFPPFYATRWIKHVTKDSHPEDKLHPASDICIPILIFQGKVCRLWFLNVPACPTFEERSSNRCHSWSESPKAIWFLRLSKHKCQRGCKLQLFTLFMSLAAQTRMSCWRSKGSH